MRYVICHTPGRRGDRPEADGRARMSWGKKTGEEAEKRRRRRRKTHPTTNQNTHQTRTMRRRIADLGASKDGQLALDPVRGFVRRRDDVQCSDTLAVQPSVLRKTLYVITERISTSFVQSHNHDQIKSPPFPAI